MAVNVKLFHTKLRANIHPTEEILADFNNLPKFSPNTVMDYLWFFRTYGSHLHYASYYGGQFLVLIYHNKNSGNETKTRLPDPLAINALINEALSTEKGSETKVSVFSTGGTADKHQVTNNNTKFNKTCTCLVCKLIIRNNEYILGGDMDF